MTKKHPVKEEEEEGIKKEEENQPEKPVGTVTITGCAADPMKEEPISPLKQEPPSQAMPPRSSLEEVSTTFLTIYECR